MPLYRHGLNIVFFVHIPKTGGTSIEHALRSAGAAEALRFKGKRDFSRSTLQHMHASVYLDALREDFYDWTFSVVRNPFDRFASEYKMKVLDAGGTDDVESWAETNFTRYAEYNYTRDNHVRPQEQFITTRTDIFRFEDGLDQPIRAAVDQLGLDMPAIPHAKRGSTRKPLATERAIALIADFYAGDFERFGYDTTAFESAFELTD